jgi:hypothetical protein
MEIATGGNLPNVRDTEVSLVAEIQENIPASIGQRVKVVYEGETADAEELKFKLQNDPVSLCELSDGASIDIRLGLKSVYRLCDKKKADGSPIYLLTGNFEAKVKPKA